MCLQKMVLEAGIEPARLTSADFKSAVATYYTTRALVFQLYENTLILGISMTAAHLGLIRCLVSCLWVRDYSFAWNHYCRTAPPLLWYLTYNSGRIQPFHGHAPCVPPLSDCLLHGVVQARAAAQRNLYKTLVDSITLMCLLIVASYKS